MVGAIEFSGVKKSFRRPDGEIVHALNGVDLKIEQGDFVCLIGPSGCGKSTMLRLLAGLDQPTEGAVYLDGEKITRPNCDRGLVFQDPNLFPWLNIYDNISFGLRARHIFKQKRDSVREFMDLVGLTGFEKSYPHQLSGGMLQRIMIGIATSMKPSLLIADEPTTAIDAITQFEILDELLRIKQEHQTAMVFISHDLNAISRVADRIVVLNQGLVVDQGDFQHILHHATDSYTKLLVEKRTDVMRRYSQVLGGKERVYA